MSRFARERRVFFVEEPVFDSNEPLLKTAVCSQTGVHVVRPHLPVEGDRNKLLEVRIALRDQNFHHVLHLARDGEEAITFIEKADNDAMAPGPDLLLLDMHLPKYDGEAILKRLRSPERYAQIPVVVMTSSDAPQDRDRAQKHAAIFYFRKPSRLEEFIQLGVIVREILTGKKPLDIAADDGPAERGDAA